MKKTPFFLLIAATVFIASACTAVKFNQKERLADPIMIFDYDPLLTEMRGHILTPREASIGGFTSIGAGGCGCN